MLAVKNSVRRSNRKLGTSNNKKSSDISYRLLVTAISKDLSYKQILAEKDKIMNSNEVALTK